MATEIPNQNLRFWQYLTPGVIWGLYTHAQDTSGPTRPFLVDFTPSRVVFGSILGPTDVCDNRQPKNVCSRAVSSEKTLVSNKCLTSDVTCGPWKMGWYGIRERALTCRNRLTIGLCGTKRADDDADGISYFATQDSPDVFLTDSWLLTFSSVHMHNENSHMGSRYAYNFNTIWFYFVKTHQFSKHTAYERPNFQNNNNDLPQLD